MTSEELLTCPFCGEGEMDAIGLKVHLERRCQTYCDTDISGVHSFFCDPLVPQSDALREACRLLEYLKETWISNPVPLGRIRAFLARHPQK